MKPFTAKDITFSMRVHAGTTITRNTVFWIKDEGEPDFGLPGREVGIVLNPSQLRKLQQWIDRRLEEIETD